MTTLSFASASLTCRQGLRNGINRTQTARSEALHWSIESLRTQRLQYRDTVVFEMGKRAILMERKGRSRDEIYESLKGLEHYLPQKKSATVENEEKQQCAKIANERKWDSGNRWYHYQKYLPQNKGGKGASGNTSAASSSTTRPSATMMAAVAASLTPGANGLTTEGNLGGAYIHHCRFCAWTHSRNAH